MRGPLLFGCHAQMRAHDVCLCYVYVPTVILLCYTLVRACGSKPINIKSCYPMLPYRYASSHGPLARYVKLRIVHALGMPGMISPPPTSKETASKRSRYASRHVHNARAVMHVGIANPRWRGKRSRHSRRMRNPQFYVFGKRPMHGTWAFCICYVCLHTC